MSWDFDVLGKVIMKRGVFTVVVTSAYDRRAVDLCLTLISSKPVVTNPPELSFARAETGRCHMTAFIGFRDSGTAFIGFWGLGQKVKYGKFLV
jgi:hypothetical protein